MHEVETQLQVFIACNILFIFINMITLSNGIFLHTFLTIEKN